MSHKIKFWDEDVLDCYACHRDLPMEELEEKVETGAEYVLDNADAPCIQETESWVQEALQKKTYDKDVLLKTREWRGPIHVGGIGGPLVYRYEERWYIL